jgi:hypothetical protein
MVAMVLNHRGCPDYKIEDQMSTLKIAKILFLVGVMSFVARPFVGYALFDKFHNPVEDNILVKIFSKRKPELCEDDNFSAIQKKLANTDQRIFFHCTNFLDILFPAANSNGTQIKSRLLLPMQPSPTGQTWLLCGKIII